MLFSYRSQWSLQIAISSINLLFKFLRNFETE